jgi:hypothetical protein
MILCVGVLAASSTLAQQNPAACARSIVPLAQRRPLRDFSGPLPIPDYLDGVIACNTPRVAMGLPGPQVPTTSSVHSPWMESERELYQGVLARQHADLLVVPFQVQGYGLDRIERALMAADLAHAIGRAGKLSVADPWVVARALGEGARRIDPTSARRLAQALGARKILYGYVGHDDHHAFTLSLQLEEPVQDLPAPSPWQQDWRAIAFTDERTPAQMFHEMLPQIVAALPLGLKFAHETARAPARAAARIELSPRDLTSSNDSKIASLAGLVTLGGLSSPSAELARERIFERALLAAWNTTGGGPADRLLESYAFFSLGRRPSALQALNGDTSPAARTLRALIDGDLPLATQSFAAVPDSIERLLLQISLQELETAYDRKRTDEPVDIAKVFGPAFPAWQPLVEQRLKEVDPWNTGDPEITKLLLDRNVPEPGLELDSLTQGAAVAGTTIPDSTDIDIANMRHVRRAVEHVSVSGFGSPRDFKAQPWDLLWLLESRAEGRIVRQLWQEDFLQGAPDAVMAQVARYAPVLGGHPALAAARAHAAAELSQQAVTDSRANWIAQSKQAASIAAAWDPGQNRTAYTALLALGIPSPESAFLVDAYGHDYPRRAYWPSFFFGSEDPAARGAAALEALTFSSADLSPLAEIPPGNGPGQAGAVIASLGDRFTGNPLKPEPNSTEAAESNPDAIVAKLRKSIQADPEPWLNYSSLGTLLIDSRGDYEEASRVFMSYPGFHLANGRDAVDLSNSAFEAGSAFYQLGQFELAKPFYAIAADLDTGSSASMSARARLDLIDADYPRAVKDLLQHASAYSSANSYRDYLSFLHAFGQGDAAWRAFAQLDASFDIPQVWVSALVGQRMAGAGAREIDAWLHRPEIRDARFGATQFAPYFALLWYATDRDPPADLGDLVAELQGAPPGHIDVDGLTLLVPHPIDPKGFMAVRGSRYRANKTPLPPGTAIKSDLAYFATAYAAVRAGSFDTAVSRFEAMADRYPIEDYPLAYFAFAAAESGDKGGLEKYLDTLKANPNFDYWLARAFFAGRRKDADGARYALQRAFRQRPSTGKRPISSDYQYAEACEWLYRDTQDARFLADLSAWVRAVQISAPTQAWSYAMEYSYAPPGPAKTRALAMTRYLDPLSKRIHNAPANEVRAADAWFRDNNPFRPGAALTYTARN